MTSTSIRMDLTVAVAWWRVSSETMSRMMMRSSKSSLAPDDGDHGEEELQSESEELSDESDGEIHSSEDEQEAENQEDDEEEEEDEEDDEDEDEDDDEVDDDADDELRQSDGSDGENAVDDGRHQAQQEQGEEEPPQPPRDEGGDGVAAAAVVDGDLAQPAPRPLSPMTRSAPESSAIGEITVERTDALDCGICFLPLKPPIFLCDVGHVVCSPCRDKLTTAAGGSRCHVCRAPTDFRRCHVMEQLVDSIRMACPHAAHGCADRPAYHARECAHAPCRCPGSACTFSAPVAALADHLAAAHGWPSTAEAEAGRSFGVDLRDGFNFVTAVRSSAQHLILLNVASTAFARAVSAVWLRPQAATAASSAAAPEGRKATTCEVELKYSRYHYGHYQSSRSEVACCTDGSSELPDPNASFQFFIPKNVAGSAPDKAYFHVTAGVYINS